MAEKTNVGMAFFIADITSMCGIGSDGAAALLSACSFVCCCSHQFLFPCLEVLFQSTPPLCAISCKALPGHRVDVDILHYLLRRHRYIADEGGRWYSSPKPAHRNNNNKLYLDTLSREETVFKGVYNWYIHYTD